MDTAINFKSSALSQRWADWRRGISLEHCDPWDGCCKVKFHGGLRQQRNCTNCGVLSANFSAVWPKDFPKTFAYRSTVQDSNLDLTCCPTRIRASWSRHAQTFAVIRWQPPSWKNQNCFKFCCLFIYSCSRKCWSPRAVWDIPTEKKMTCFGSEGITCWGVQLSNL